MYIELMRSIVQSAFVSSYNHGSMLVDRMILASFGTKIVTFAALMCHNLILHRET